MSFRINLQPREVDSGIANIERGCYSILPNEDPSYAVSPRNGSDCLEIIQTANPPQVSRTILTTFDRLTKVVFSGICDLVLH